MQTPPPTPRTVAAQKVPITLSYGEKIICEIKPLARLKWYWILPTAVILFLILLLFSIGPIIVVFVGKGITGARIGVIAFLVAFLVLFSIIFLVASLKYKWEYYWITNKRVIRRAGFIGYTYYSTPLERISDVIVTKGLLERIFGFGSLHLQTMAGQVTYGGYGRGAEIVFYGLPNPESVQKLLFELIEQKRKREKLAF